ncbi:MAG TPA: aldo/keto reductase [Planctomycetaceae bacterium]|nr:aldo/keto reductase [Planctomycetaceae bacterium]
MQYRRLGRTELEVSLLSIGGLYTSSLGGGEAETHHIMRRAIDLGINAVDTAPAYADSEATVGAAMSGIEAPVIMTTKLGGRPQPFDPRDADALKSSVDESLRLLGREHVELLMIHEPDRPQQYPWFTDYSPLQGPVLEVMDELKAAGKIRYLGLAGTTVTELSQLVRSGRFDVVLTAFNFNALFREAEHTVFPAAKDHDMGIVLGSAFGQGFLTRRDDRILCERPVWLAEARALQLHAYYDLLDLSGIPAFELCLRFAIGHPDVSTIPIGCKTSSQLEACVRAVEKGPLPNDVTTRLGEISSMLPCRPFEEPMILPLGKNYLGPGIANMGAAIQVGKLELPS